jgi:hypothetical protein
VEDTGLWASGGWVLMWGSVVCRAQTIEVTIRSAKLGVVRAEETRDNLYAAIDVAGDKVARSLKKMKEKAVAKGNWPGRGSAKGAQKISDAFEVPDALDVASSVPTDSEKEEAMEALDMPQSVKKTKVFYLDAMSAKVPSHHVVHHDAFDANHVNGRVAHNCAQKVMPKQVLCALTANARMIVRPDLTACAKSSEMVLRCSCVSDLAQV